MKAKDLAKLIEGVNPDAEVYIDLGVCHNKTKHLIYAMLNDPDMVCASIEHIDLVCSNDGGAFEVLLCPYDGEYDLQLDSIVDSFFKEHGLDKIEQE